MAPKNKKEGEETTKNSNSILTSILKEHKSEHFNYHERCDWKISSGSLLLDAALGNGIGPSLCRITGYNNEGKTPQALEICRNFLNTVPNSKVLWVIAEGRGLSEENIKRCGLKLVYAPSEWEIGSIFVLESNIYELFIKTVKELVLNNEEKIKYCFVVDSLDGMQLRDDSLKDITENNRVCGVPAMSKKLLQSLSLGMFKFGHLMLLLSQVTSEIKIDKYEKTVSRGGNFSGGNALNHGANIILFYQNSYNSDYIMDNPNGKLNDGKSKPIGKQCKVIIEKSLLESTRKTQVVYPIKFGRKPSGIWREDEIAQMLLAWSLVDKAGAGWMTFTPEILVELKALDPDIPEKIQGLDNLRDYLESNQKVSDYLFDKFKKILS